MNRWLERHSRRRVFFVVWVGYSVGWAALVTGESFILAATSHLPFKAPPLWALPLNTVAAVPVAAWITRRAKQTRSEGGEDIH
jgi:hypothetical protein